MSRPPDRVLPPTRVPHTRPGPPRPGPHPRPPPPHQPPAGWATPRGGQRKAGLTRSLRVGRRREPAGRRPGPGVPLGRLPQVVLEAHLPGLAAAPEPPQAEGRTPQKASALARERGQVVHVAAAGPRGRGRAAGGGGFRGAATQWAPARPTRRGGRGSAGLPGAGRGEERASPAWPRDEPSGNHAPGGGVQKLDKSFQKF